MNYYEARQRKDKSGWHYTCKNDGAVWPVGYCTDHEPHDTAEEAVQCFHTYLLDDISEVNYSDWMGCVVCDAPTKKGLQTRQPLGHDYPLCDEHRTEEKVRELDPTPGRIIASY